MPTANFTQYLKDHWFMLSAIVTVAVAWGGNTAQFAAAKEQVEKNAVAIEAVKKDIGEINEAVATIQANQANAKEDIAEVKALLHEVSRKIDRNRE